MGDDPKFSPGDVIAVRPLGRELDRATTETLIRAEGLEIARIVLHADENRPARQSAGHAVLLCLEGRVTVELTSGPRELDGGELIDLPPGTRHALHTTLSSSVLYLGTKRQLVEPEAQAEARDLLDEALEESFPASDPPAISVSGGGRSAR